MWNCGRRVHSWGIRAGSVRSIQAVLFLVQSQILVPSPHSVSLCMLVSRSPHVVQRTDSVRRMVCSRSLVVRMPWITVYQLALMASDAQVLYRFVHNRAHSVVGESSVMRMSLDLLSATAIVRNVR